MISRTHRHPANALLFWLGAFSLRGNVLLQRSLFGGLLNSCKNPSPPSTTHSNFPSCCCNCQLFDEICPIFFVFRLAMSKKWPRWRDSPCCVTICSIWKSALRILGHELRMVLKVKDSHISGGENLFWYSYWLQTISFFRRVSHAWDVSGHLALHKRENPMPPCLVLYWPEIVQIVLISIWTLTIPWTF